MPQTPAAAPVDAAEALGTDAAPVDHAASDLHGGLVAGAVGAGVAWIAVSSVLMDWAWDGNVLGTQLSRGMAAWLAFASGGVAVAIVGAMLGAIVDRRIRRATLAAVFAGQAAAAALAVGLVAAFAFGLELAPRMTSVSIGAAIVLSAAATGAVLLVPRRS